VSGNAGLIEPGDYVDLLLTQQMGNRAQTADLSVSSETVVQHVRVLAVGSVIQRPKDDSGSSSDVGSRARTVTLEVTPHMAEVVSVAARLGSLSLALRSFAIESRDDAAAPEAASQPAPVWAGEISRALREMSHGAPVATGGAPAPAPVPAVAIYRGSQKSSAEDSTQPRGGPSSGSLTVSLPPLPVPTLR
jgi:pilus assembly protein CpaB